MGRISAVEGRVVRSALRGMDIGYDLIEWCRLFVFLYGYTVTYLDIWYGMGYVVI